MRVWRGNYVGSPEWEMSPEEIADGFIRSKWADPDEYQWPLERSVVAYLASSEADGGLGVGWDPKDRGFEAAVDAVAAKILSRKDGTNHD